MITQLTKDITNIVRKHAFPANATGDVSIISANRAIVNTAIEVLQRLDIRSTARDIITPELKSQLFLK